MLFRSGKSPYGLLLSGYDRAPIRGVTIEDCMFQNVGEPLALLGVEGLTLTNVVINGTPHNGIITDNVVKTEEQVQQDQREQQRLLAQQAATEQAVETAGKIAEQQNAQPQAA